MTPNQFRAWRKRLGLTQVEAAAALDITRRHYIRLEVGDAPISRVIDFACRWIEHATLQGSPPAR